ncbi:MAG: haloacid dehalogenase type II, partial [Hyphomicrobiales bacterium]|nr:haloacid dehalogenase type II [Hyphomicrobiales bacterium]
MARIEGVAACLFDAYGTLFDFASAAARCEDVPADRRAALTDLWRDRQLQYSWLRTLQRRYVDFESVTGDALDFALETFGLAEPSRRARLMDLYLTLDAYPDAASTLRRLRAAGLRTAILSNGSPAMLASAVAHSGLGDLLDMTVSVDEVGAFKTDPATYARALARLGI